LKNTRINKIFYLLLICILVIKVQYSFVTQAFADQTFENNLLKADFQKNSLGGVKLNLYTNKPYNDKVVVNKKSDFEYVVLMPEY